jgi:hypothetical protein
MAIRRRRSLALASLALAVAATVFAAASASATRVVRIKSSVTISERAPAFHGRVKSPNRACEESRKVKLYRLGPGPAVFLGTTRTNRRGKWVIHTELLGSAAYYAKVLPRREGTAGTIYVCRGDRSRTVAVD